MSPIEHAVISAAGIGSRLGLNKPKCLVEVGGKTLLAQHLERLAEIPNVWVVVGFQEELVIEQVRNLRRDAIIVRNPDFDRTNTLQSIHRVSRYLDRRFLAVDGDTFIENRSFERFLRAAAGQLFALRQLGGRANNRNAVIRRCRWVWRYCRSRRWRTAFSMPAASRPHSASISLGLACST